MTSNHLADLYKQEAERKRAILNGPYSPAQLEWDRHRGKKQTTGLLDISEQHWARHGILLAQSGNGKSNGLRWRIDQLLPHVSAGTASIILMEPKGDLTLEVLGAVHERGLTGRLNFIAPGDPAITVNLFDIDDHSAQGVNAAVQRIARIFSTITTGLSNFQANVLTFSVRAMLMMPPPRSIDTLYDILRTGIAGKDIKPSKSVRDFFAHDFAQNKARVKEVIGRLNSLLADPVLEALFSSEHTTFDMFEAMQKGTITVIDAGSADPLYGRFWIEEVDRVIKKRIALPPSKIIPTTFIIDEAAEWVSDDLHFARILDMARGAKISMFLALQHLGQIKNDHVRNSLLTNTAIKFVAKTSAHVHDLCRSLGNVETHFISRLGDYQFAFIAPNMAQAEVVKLPLVEFPRGTKPARAGEKREKTEKQETDLPQTSASPLPDEPTHEDIY